VSVIREWLEGLGMARYADAFERDDIDEVVLAELSDHDLAELGVSLGDRKRILRAVREGRGPPTPRRAPGRAPAWGRGEPGDAERQRRHVTVLFADVSGFTALSEQLDPESVHLLMDGCFTVLGEQIQRYEGTVTQYAGDGLMAIFGAPVAQEDHAARAAHAALDIQEALADYAREVEDRLGVAFRMRIGLNTGLVVVGRIGDDLRMDYTALGDTVNLAARLQQVAEPGDVVASERTRREAGDAFEWLDLGTRMVRGKNTPVRMFRIAGRRPPDGARRPSVRAGLTPLVGRSHEIGVLQEAWDSALAGAGRVVSVVGEAGLGKSRLLQEFSGRLAAGGGRYLVGTCFTYGDTTSFLPFLRIVREMCGIADGDAEPAAKRAIATRLESLGLPAEEVEPYLHNLLSYSVDDEVFPYLTPELVRRRTVQALRALLLAEADDAPLAVVIEDAHWIDRATEEAIGTLVDGLADRHLLLALAYRPEYLNQWRGRAHHDEVLLRPLQESGGAAMVRAILAKPYAASLNLPPLTSEQSLALARRLLGEDAISPALEQLIVDRTEGNPLFVEELTQALMEGGGVARREGALDLSRPADELEIPANLHGVLLARIDRLPDELAETLRVAATIGRVFSPRVLAAASRDASDVPTNLERLAELDFVHPVGTGPEGDYSFKHVLTQEAVYSTLLSRARAAYHAAVAEAYEGLYPDRLEEHAEILARHYDEAGRRERAVEFLVAANRKAVRSNAVAEAYRHLERADQLLATLPATSEHGRAWIRLLCDNVIVYQLLFKYEEYYARLQEALPVAAGLSPELEGMVLNRLSHMEWAFCDLPNSRARTERAIGIWAYEPNPQELAYAYVVLGYVQLVAGDFEEIAETEALGLAALERGFNLRWHVWTLSFASMGYAWMGRWKMALERGERALAVAEEYDDASLVCFAAWVLGLANACRGDLARALELGARAVAVAPTPSDQSWAGATHAWFLCRAGMLDEGIRSLEEAVVANRAARFIWSEVMATYLAEGYIRAGRLDDARTTLKEVSAYCAEHGMAFFGAVADRLRAEVETASGSDAEAGRRFESAIEALRRIGGRSELAEALDGIGRLELERGDPERAATFLDEARAIRQELGALPRSSAPPRA
jgi:class 3 adenylate cyclase/tetratricopeptide (TPR) repeat protein